MNEGGEVVRISKGRCTKCGMPLGNDARIVPDGDGEAHGDCFWQARAEAAEVEARELGVQLATINNALDEFGSQHQREPKGGYPAVHPPVDECVREAMTTLRARLDQERAEVIRVRGLIDRDKTGLANGLAAVLRVVEGYRWLARGEWGVYEAKEHTQETLRKEFGWALDAIAEIVGRHLDQSGMRADAAFRGGPGPVESVDLGGMVALAKDHVVVMDQALDGFRREWEQIGRDHLRKVVAAAKGKTGSDRTRQLQEELAQIAKELDDYGPAHLRNGRRLSLVECVRDVVIALSVRIVTEKSLRRFSESQKRRAQRAEDMLTSVVSRITDFILPPIPARFVIQMGGADEATRARSTLEGAVQRLVEALKAAEARALELEVKLEDVATHAVDSITDDTPVTTGAIRQCLREALTKAIDQDKVQLLVRLQRDLQTEADKVQRGLNTIDDLREQLESCRAKAAEAAALADGKATSDNLEMLRMQSALRVANELLASCIGVELRPNPFGLSNEEMLMLGEPQKVENEEVHRLRALMAKNAGGSHGG